LGAPTVHAGILYVPDTSVPGKDCKLAPRKKFRKLEYNYSPSVGLLHVQSIHKRKVIVIEQTNKGYKKNSSYFPTTAVFSYKERQAHVIELLVYSIDPNSPVSCYISADYIAAISGFSKCPRGECLTTLLP